MTGLPYVAENIRSVLKWSLISVVTLFSLWVLWVVFSFTYKLIFPPPPAPPDVAFGKLRQPVTFNSTFSANLFILDTPGNTFVSPPKALQVYEIPRIEGEFASLDNAKKIARNAGLDSEPQQLSDNEWRWTNKKNPNKSLKFNIVTNNFVYTYDWNADTKVLEGNFKTNDEAIISKAKGQLTSFKALKDDLKNGTTRISYWKIVGKDRNSVGSYSEANAVMVEFFRQEIDKENKLIELNPDRAQVNVWLSPSAGDNQLLELNYTYFSYSKDKTATYPPKSGTQAFEDLKTAKAFIAKGLNETFETITITKTYLAYLNPNTDRRTLQQVYVFEGNGIVKGEKKDFVAYVPAITKDYQR
mgnify:CR=1 FL=1